MAQIIKMTKDISALSFKHYVSIKSFPFIGSSFPETLSLAIRYAKKSNIDIAVVFNKLSAANFATQLVTRVFGDVRRTVARLEKVLIPSILFSFIDSAISATNLTLTKKEVVIVKMIHLSLFKQWGAVVDSSIPASVSIYDKLTPSREELLMDMIRVFTTNKSLDFIPKDLPKDRVSAPLVAQHLLDIYTDLHTAIVNINNIDDQMRVIFAVLKTYIQDEMVFPHLHSDPSFMAMTNNITLVNMALSQDTTATVSKFDGWFVDQSIKSFNEYIRSEAADIVIYSIDQLASTHSAYRFVNENNKQVKAIMVTPNFKEVKWAHWFHRELAYGDQFVKLLKFRDPSGIIEPTTKTLSPGFLEEQLVTTLSDLVQYMPDLKSGYSQIDLMPPGIKKDMLQYLAMSRSEHISITKDGIEFYYRLDDALVTTHDISVTRFDSTKVARTFDPWNVIAYSGKIPTSSLAFPMRVQTLELISEGVMFVKEDIIDQGLALNTAINMNDSFYVDGVPIGLGVAVTVKDFIFNGDPIELIKISYSKYLTSTIENLIDNLTAYMVATQSISHIKARIFQNFWAAIKKNATTQEFEWAASNYRRLLEVRMDPTRPQDASRNYVKSVVALTRFAFALGTNVSIDKLTTMMNGIFEGQIDIVGMLNDNEIARITT